MSVWARGGAVHPHMRGEYSWNRKRAASTAGSSPHAWRICLCYALVVLVSRFIPTCVENILAQTNALRRRSVHPHMRGEYFTVTTISTAKNGSSPHAWRIWMSLSPEAIERRFIPTCVENILSRVVYVRRAPRFIPTCVENIEFKIQDAWIGAVHPHMRGEYA